MMDWMVNSSTFMLRHGRDKYCCFSAVLVGIAFFIIGPPFREGQKDGNRGRGEDELARLLG